MARDGPFTYKRHEPEKTLLYQVVAAEWRTWRAERKADLSRSPLPKHVDREVEAFLRCGILEYGFVLCACDDCGKEIPVATSCKTRGFCPSCAAKRQAETTAHLVDNVLPDVPWRQYVTTFPHALRFWMAASRLLTNIVHRIVADEIMGYYLGKAEERGIRDAHAGGATFVQRFGSALQLNVHLHSLVAEGVWSVASGEPVFYHLPGPNDDEVASLVEAVADKVVTMLREKSYLSEEGAEVDLPPEIDREFADSQQWQAAVTASSFMRVAFGPHAGEKVRRIGRGFGYMEEIPFAKGRRCYSINGFTIHANRFIGARERDKLEGLVSYVARGAFSHKRLSLADPDDPDGELVYQLKTPWSDGTSAILLSRGELIEKLVALVPPPYLHTSRYFGVLSPHSKWRRSIVLRPFVKKGFVATGDGDKVKRMNWSRLLARTYKIDITVCLVCGGRVKPENCEAVLNPAIIPHVLLALGLRYHPPPIAPSRLGWDESDIDQRPTDSDD